MSQHIQAALRRVEAIFQRRPEAGLHDDIPANARWIEGTEVVVSHQNGARFATDLPVELGGGGRDVTPGWFFRAGVASCAVSSIVIAAAAEGVELTTIEADAGSRSDARGMLGMIGADGAPVPAQPEALQVRIRLSARGATAEALRALVERAMSRSPIPCAVRNAVPLVLQIDAAPPA